MSYTTLYKVQITEGLTFGTDAYSLPAPPTPLDIVESKKSSSKTCNDCGYQGIDSKSKICYECGSTNIN